MEKSGKAVDVALHFMDIDKQYELSSPFYIENIAQIASKEYRFPVQQFMDRCRTYYINSDDQQIEIHDRQDFLDSIYSGRASKIFVQLISIPIHFVDIGYDSQLSWSSNMLQEIQQMASIAFRIVAENFWAQYELYYTIGQQQYCILRQQDLKWLFCSEANEGGIFVELKGHNRGQELEEVKQVHFQPALTLKPKSQPAKSSAMSPEQRPSMQNDEVPQSEIHRRSTEETPALDMTFQTPTFRMAMSSDPILEVPEETKRPLLQEIEGQPKPRLFRAFWQKIRSYDCIWSRFQESINNQSLSFYKDGGERYTFLSNSSFFLSGGMTKMGAIGLCFEIDITMSEVSSTQVKEAMKVQRANHGIVKFDQQHMYAFGGKTKRCLDRAERYDIENNEWEEIAKMPIASDYISCVCHMDQIFMTGLEFVLISYTPSRQNYRIIQGRDPKVQEHKLLSKVNQILYLLQTNNTIELDSTGEASKSIIGMGIGPAGVRQSYIKENKVYFLTETDEIHCIDISNGSMATHLETFKTS